MTLPTHQKGITLIELMVSLVVAMLCMIMMLMIFKQISNISIHASKDAEYEAQLQTGMMVMEKFIQNAGYGSGKTRDVAIGSFAGNPAVFWRYNADLNASPIVYHCQGIAEQISSSNASSHLHRIVLIQKSNCGDGTNEALTDGNWQVSQAITSIENTSASPVFTYALSSSDCRPFGIDKENAGAQQLTLTAARPHITESSYALEAVICLNNIKATT